MTLSYGPNLGLLINAATGEAHADAFRAFKRGVDALVMPAVLDRTDTPPGSPANGDRYLLGASPTGAWAGNANKIARYNGTGWEFYTPINGWSVVVVDEATVYRYLSGAWTAATSSGSSAISGTLSVDNGSTAYTATRTGQIATIKSGTLSTTELLIGMRSTGIPAIQSARSTDDAAQELQIQPFGGSTRIGSGIVSGGVGSGDLIVVGGASVGGALNVGGAGYFSSNVGIGTTNPQAKISFPDMNSATTTADGMTWYSGDPTLYGIYKTAGSWSAPNYQQLKVSFPTGIIIDGGTVNAKSGTVLQPNGGNVGIGTTTPTNILSFGGNSARTIWMERHTTANTAGNSLTLESGGATTGATDKDGGILYIDPGTSTGTGKNSVRIRRRARASSTGTSDNAKREGIVIPSIFNLTDESANSIFEIPLPAGAMCGGVINFTITCSDGTEKQVYTGIVSYAAVNKAGAYTVNSPESSATSALTGGSTLTTSWALVSGTNKVTMQLTPTSSLTPTIMQLAYTVTNSCGIDITQL